MVYAVELDDRIFEIRRGGSGLVYFWPKAEATGNTAATFVSASIYKPGDSTTAITAITPTTRTIDDVTRFDFTIDASASATYQLDENYRIDLTWTYLDADAITRTQFDSVRFDVCREPMNPRVSLNDLIDEVHDIGARLTTMGRAVATTQTPEIRASVFGAKGWQDVRARLKSQLQGQGKILPRCLIDRAALHRATVAAAIRLVFMSNAGGSDSESAELRDFWAEETSARVREIGPAADYDSNQDGVPDMTLAGFGSVRVRRGWM